MGKQKVEGHGGGETTELHAVFVDTNLETHLALLVSKADTVFDLKQKVVLEHSKCFPDFGDISIHALKVKRKANHYHLSDSMLVRTAFSGVGKTWFLAADISSQIPDCQATSHPDGSIKMLLAPGLTLSPQVLGYPHENQRAQTNGSPNLQIVVNCKNDVNFRSSSSDSAGKRYGQHGQKVPDSSGAIHKVSAVDGKYKEKTSKTWISEGPFANSEDESLASRTLGKSKRKRKKRRVGVDGKALVEDNVIDGRYVENKQATGIAPVGPDGNAVADTNMESKQALGITHIDCCKYSIFEHLNKTDPEIEQPLDSVGGGNKISETHTDLKNRVSDVGCANELEGIQRTGQGDQKYDTGKRKRKMLNSPILQEDEASTDVLAKPKAQLAEALKKNFSGDVGGNRNLHDDTDQRNYFDNTAGSDRGTEKTDNMLELAKTDNKSTAKVDPLREIKSLLCGSDKRPSKEPIIREINKEPIRLEGVTDTRHGEDGTKSVGVAPEPGVKRAKKRKKPEDDAIAKGYLLSFVDRSGNLKEDVVHQTEPSNANWAEEASENNAKQSRIESSASVIKEMKNDLTRAKLFHSNTAVNDESSSRRKRKGKKVKDFDVQMQDLSQKQNIKDQTACTSSHVLGEDHATHNLTSEDDTKGELLTSTEKTKQTKLNSEIILHEQVDMEALDSGQDNEEPLQLSQVQKGERRTKNKSKEANEQQISSEKHKSVISVKKGDGVRESAWSKSAKTSFKNLPNGLNLESMKDNKIECELSHPGPLHGAVDSALVLVFDAEDDNINNKNKPRGVPLEAGSEEENIESHVLEEVVSEGPQPKVVFAPEVESDFRSSKADVDNEFVDADSKNNDNDQVVEDIGQQNEMRTLQLAKLHKTGENAKIKSAKPKKKTKQQQASKATAEKLSDCPLEEQERSVKVDRSMSKMGFLDQSPGSKQGEAKGTKFKSSTPRPIHGDLTSALASESDVTSSETRGDNKSLRNHSSNDVGHQRKADDICQNDLETLQLTPVHRTEEDRKDKSEKTKKRTKKQQASNLKDSPESSLKEQDTKAKSDGLKLERSVVKKKHGESAHQSGLKPSKSLEEMVVQKPRADPIKSKVDGVVPSKHTAYELSGIACANAGDASNISGTLSARSDTFDQTSHQGRNVAKKVPVSKQLPMSVEKSSKKIAKIVKNSPQRKSLVDSSGSIFSRGSNSSSEEDDEEENEGNDSDCSTRTPSEHSSSSDYSEGESKDVTRRGSEGKILNSQSSNQKKTMELLFKNSSNYKQAKLVASQSLLEDSESQPVDFVPDSQANL